MVHIVPFYGCQTVLSFKKWEQFKCFCDRLLITKSLKIQFKISSLLSLLLSVGTTSVHSLSQVPFLYLIPKPMWSGCCKMSETSKTPSYFFHYFFQVSAYPSIINHFHWSLKLSQSHQIWLDFFLTCSLCSEKKTTYSNIPIYFCKWLLHCSSG